MNWLDLDESMIDLTKHISRRRLLAASGSKIYSINSIRPSILVYALKTEMVKPKVDPDFQLAEFLEHKHDLFIGDKVKPCTDEIFSILSEKLGMTSRAVYLSVVRKKTILLNSFSQNLHSFTKSETCTQNEEFNSNQVDQSIESADRSIESVNSEPEQSNNKSIESNESTSSNADGKVSNSNLKVKGNTVSFATDVSMQDIFGASYKLQGTKTRLKATPGWAWKIRNVIWQNFKSQCSWSFKSADPNALGEVRFGGKCLGCEAEMQLNFSAEGRMEVHIRNYNAKVAHEKQKHRIRGAGKQHFDKLLDNASAHSVYTSEANRLMEKGDPIPSILQSQNAMRIGKHRNNAVGRCSMSVIESLIQMKSKSHAAVIGDISIFPFSVTYQLPMQKEAYKHFTNRKRSSVSIDSTGFNMHTSSFLPSNDKMPIFLYTLTGHVPGQTLPFYQVISSRHSQSFIVGWLSSWLKENKKPDEVFVDDSAALVGACVQTFAKCHSTNEYITVCTNNALFAGPLPKAYIRLDRSHFIRSLHRLKALSKEEDRKKILYKRIFGVLITCDNIHDAEKIIKNLFTILNLKYATETCVKALDELKMRCESDGTDMPDVGDDIESPITIESAEPADQVVPFDQIQEGEVASFLLCNEDGSYKGTSSYR